MSNLVPFEDLVMLDGQDLRAVLGQVTIDQQVQAFLGAPQGFRQMLLTRLPASASHQLSSEIESRSSMVSSEGSEAAQHAIIEVLCRMGRTSQVAFVDPEDMW